MVRCLLSPNISLPSVPWESPYADSKRTHGNLEWNRSARWKETPWILAQKFWMACTPRRYWTLRVNFPRIYLRSLCHGSWPKAFDPFQRYQVWHSKYQIRELIGIILLAPRLQSILIVFKISFHRKINFPFSWIEIYYYLYWRWYCRCCSHLSTCQYAPSSQHPSILPLLPWPLPSAFPYPLVECTSCIQ